ncbi:DUF2634 domain-containing protein [Paenibacillus naphthalenovorans]|uniref:DUF2634 domain-containing protein n=1 Tax=Paenibacillus naphthalenovorans TaxID=162209 RepID=UPI00089006B6|nr:DUF2634 domain-containing protein [Paenibacillus naphthalenovorans]SDJ76190.1 Protein of unknown function [Paenibacillus naphthalenovorans]
MIPTGGQIQAQSTTTIQQPSRTWKLDFERGRVTGMVDGLDAVRQAVFKILQTERFAFLVYSSNFGVELKRFAGPGQAYVQSELKRRIREALMQDDRITDVTDFQITFAGDTAHVEFAVVSTFGRFEAAQEVTGIV